MQIYHITHINNLDNILTLKYLFCDNDVCTKAIAYINVAHNSIKERRLITPVTICAQQVGVVGEYVPFYFSVRSPMLYAIHTGYVASYKGCQSDIVYLCFNTDDFVYSDCSWCYSDGNAAADITAFFNDKEFKNIDLTLIRSRTWKNTDEDPDRKRRKQAEFLVHNKVRIDMIKQITVQNKEASVVVAAILQAHKLQYSIKIEPSWYY